MHSRTLVIEDNPTNLELMSYLLKAFGHSVIEATDGESGLLTARRERPDRIVCDIHLPGIDGYEVARQLKQDAALRTIPLIAVTALAMVGDRDKVLAAGFDGYIAKPINPKSFVGQVEAVLSPETRSMAEPRSSHGPALPTTGIPTSTPSGATILVVDNTTVNLELTRSTLEPFGYEIVSATGAAQALELARYSRPDMIVSDVHMPGENGYDLIKAIKADPELNSVVFVFLTSTAWRDVDMARALGLGAADFITRPIDPRQLLERIETCLRNRKRN